MKYKLRIVVSTTNFLKLNPKHELISLIYAEHEMNQFSLIIICEY